MFLHIPNNFINMVLDEDSKKLLTNEIDDAIHGLPSSMTMARHDSIKKLFRVENDWDFAIGFAMGQIIRVIQIDISQKYDRKLTNDENNELTDAIWERIDDFQRIIKKWT